MQEFLTSNSVKYRLLRTIIQGLMGVMIANMDTLFSFAAMDPAVKTVIVAAVMAILSPVMAEIGKAGDM